MYEALLKATQEYQKIAASFAKPGPAALFGLPPAGRALPGMPLAEWTWAGWLCIVDPGRSEATHFADDLKALGLAVSDCDGILVTHEHSDHVKGMSTFLKKEPAAGVRRGRHAGFSGCQRHRAAQL